jgi:hypothetical protein
MSVFADSKQLYAVAEALFARVVAENPGAVAQLLRTRMLVRLVCTNPAGEIWLQARKPPWKRTSATCGFIQSWKCRWQAIPCMRF